MLTIFNTLTKELFVVNATVKIGIKATNGLPQHKNIFSQAIFSHLQIYLFRRLFTKRTVTSTFDWTKTVTA